MKNSIDFKLKNSVARVNPFVYSEPSVSVISIRMLVLLFLQIVALLVTKSFMAVNVILVSTLGAVLASVLCNLLTKKQVYQFFTLIVQGILLGMLLPQTFPLQSVFAISFCIFFVLSLFVCKNVNTWINVVTFCTILAWIIGRRFFPDFAITKELLQIKNPSAMLIRDGVFPIYGFDIGVTDFLNNTIFNHFNVKLPAGYISLLVDTNSIIPAFRFNLLTIISSIILFSDVSYSGIVPTLFLVVYAVLVRLFSPVLFGGAFNQGDVILALLTSGTLFCSVFVIQWYGTIPVSIIGKVLYGIFTGIIAFLVVGSGTSPIGMVYTVLICNVLNILICFFEEKVKFNMLKKVVQKSKSTNEDE